MIKTDLPRQRSRPPTISYYAMAVLSVAVGIIVAQSITRFLHAEAIASSMLCAVICAAWVGGFGPALLAIALALLAFHFYLLPPIDAFVWKNDLFDGNVSEIPRLVLFFITTLFVAFLISAQKKNSETLRRSRDDLQAATEDQERIKAALLRSEMY
jgi:K+-sensing histidine kinase KdpD